MVKPCWARVVGQVPIADCLSAWVGEMGQDGGGEVVEVGPLPLQNEGGLGEGGGPGGAGLARIRFGLWVRRGLDASVQEHLRSALLYIAGVEVGDATAEVFDGIEDRLRLAASADGGDSYADGGEFWVEQVGAMGRAVHPGVVDLRCGAGVSGDVLGDGAEVDSGLGGAGEEVRLAGVLMLGGASCAGGEIDVKAGCPR